MTLRQWIADEWNGDSAAILGENARHFATVLRGQSGEECRVSCGGRVRRGTVSSVSPLRVEFALHEELGQGTDESAHLLISVFKFDRFEWAVEKVTELGATRITPVIAHHTDVHLASAAAKRVERWRRIAREAAQQSRRPRVPAIDDACKLRDGLRSFVSGSRLVLAESERDTSLADFLYSSAIQSPLVIAAGPEGGWTPQELSDFSGSGWKSVSLGRGILRAETAVIAAMALVAASLPES